MNCRGKESASCVYGMTKALIFAEPKAHASTCSSVSFVSARLTFVSSRAAILPRAPRHAEPPDVARQQEVK